MKELFYVVECQVKMKDEDYEQRSTDFTLGIFGCTEKLNDYERKLQAALEVIKIQGEAIEFYANEETFGFTYCTPGGFDYYTAVDDSDTSEKSTNADAEVGGRRARQAKEQTKELLEKLK